MKYIKNFLPFFLIFFLTSFAASDCYAKGLEYISSYELSDIYPEGDNYKQLESSIPATAVYKNNKLIGYIYLTTDIVSSIGYSGKPIETIVGLDIKGNIVGAKVIEHHEPILLAGISMSSFDSFIDQHIGLNIYKKKNKLDKGTSSDVDLVSGATVTAMVANDSIMRSGRKFLASLNAGDVSEEKKEDVLVLKEDIYQQKTWAELISDKSISRITLSHDDVNSAFGAMGGPINDLYGEYDSNKDSGDFIDLYTGLITPSSIGNSLLGDDEYKWLKEKKLKENEHAIIIAANGAFSFRGSGFVRGGIFDRILLVQGENSFRFRDSDYKRIGDFVQEDAPHFQEIGIFVLRNTEFKDNDFNPTKPWRLELLVSRHVGALEKIFTSFSVNYDLPDIYINNHKEETYTIDTFDDEKSLWQKIWHDRMVDITILSIALFLLTIVFFVQDYLVHYPKLLERIRIGFLLFSLFWIGGYAQAQLSIVNVLTFTHSLLTGFNWEFFLLDPMLFILWSSVAVSLLFWGRGVFCGWLCPFGALQELLNRVAKWVGIKQLKIPFYFHERLWTVKYMIFIGLLALSLSSMAMAELASEIEPFKTVIILHFSREWYFSLYAALLLGAALINERFFCRYLCPLGAALAIPANNRLFRWLKRRDECGRECGRCATHCMVQAIHDSGEINANECLYCLGCQVIYYDKNTCLPLIMQRKKREQRIKSSTTKASCKTKECKAKECKNDPK